MNKGDKMLCDIIDPKTGERTGGRIAVEVREVRRDHMTQAPRSVRVATLEDKQRFIWVQPQFLIPRGHSHDSHD